MTESPYYYKDENNTRFSIDPEKEIKFFEEVIWVINELYESTSIVEKIRELKAKEGADGDSVLASFIILKDQASDILKIIERRIEQINEDASEIL